MTAENPVQEILDRVPKGFETFVRSILSADLPPPAVTTAMLMDFLLPEDDWWEFEPETIRELLARASLFPNYEIRGQIQALAAIRKGESFIDKEWHLFEKAVLAVNGVPVFFFEKQNIPIEYILHSISIMKVLGPFEPSEEVKHYIGAETLNDEILWHPTPFIDQCLSSTIERIGETMALDMDDISALRAKTKARFEELSDKDISKIELTETPEDIMCGRIIRSLAIGQGLTRREKEYKAALDRLLNGEITMEGVQEEIKAALKPSADDSLSADDVAAGETEVMTMDMLPDTSVFDDMVKNAFVSFFADSHVYNKSASMVEGLPITTGAYLSGMEDHSDDPDRDHGTTSPMKGTAEEAMREAASNSNVSRGTASDANESLAEDSDEGLRAFTL